LTTSFHLFFIILLEKQKNLWSQLKREKEKETVFFVANSISTNKSKFV
jgi:hypothetical protein